MTWDEPTTTSSSPSSSNHHLPPPSWKDHPVLQSGITVSIGLGKNTRLSAVFDRYVTFVNAQQPIGLTVEQLEFVHCQLLSPDETPEVAALMKNDTIRVRCNRHDERVRQEEDAKWQRESDREFFEQLRPWVVKKTSHHHDHRHHNNNNNNDDDDTTTWMYHDTILECQGTPPDPNGRSAPQPLPPFGFVPSSTVNLVPCHAAMVKKRCPWLGAMITQAQRDKPAKQPEAPNHDDNNNNNNNNVSPKALPEHAAVPMEEDASAADVLPRPAEQLPEPANHAAAAAAAAQIENDEGDSFVVEPTPSLSRSSSSSPQLPPLAPSVPPPQPQPQPSARLLAENAKMIWVTLPNHSPEAVQLLLEYLYTNRVVSLGVEAFVQSCRTKPLAKYKGPVPPYPIGASAVRRWPNRGEPTISFRLALATLLLAEEANLPRLSLMCEIAAAQLVTVSNVVDALTVCERQKKRAASAAGSGSSTVHVNPLPRLRKVAMDYVLRSGPRPVFVLPTFRQALEERSTSFVPTLLVGAMEALEQDEVKKKSLQQQQIQHSYLHHHHHHQHQPPSQLAPPHPFRTLDPSDWQAAAWKHFKQIDREDHARRDRERKKRRYERMEATAAANHRRRSNGEEEEEEEVAASSSSEMAVRWNPLCNNNNNYQAPGAPRKRTYTLTSVAAASAGGAAKPQRLPRRGKNNDSRRRGGSGSR